MVEAAIFHGPIKEDGPHPNELGFSELNTESRIKVKLPVTESGTGVLTVITPVSYKRNQHDTDKITYSSRFEISGRSGAYVSFSHQETELPDEDESLLWMDPFNNGTMVCYSKKASATENGPNVLPTQKSIVFNSVTHEGVQPHPIGWR